MTPSSTTPPSPILAASPTHKHAIRRVQDPEILPFETWDLIVENSLWAEQYCGPDFPVALRRGIHALHAGLGETRSRGPIPSSVAGFDAVYLAGGRAARIFQECEPASTPLIVAANAGAFAGAPGGLHWLQRNDYLGWVLDLGQSQLKLATPNRQWAFSRDSTRLRAAGEVSPAEIPTQRRRLREYLALKLEFVLNEESQPPDALVAGLPSPLSEDGTPVGGNYSGLRGYRELLPDALSLIGLDEAAVFVLNDAELAAHSARLDPRLSGFRKILVLTLGFGIGAALIQR